MCLGLEHGPRPPIVGVITTPDSSGRLRASVQQRASQGDKLVKGVKLESVKQDTSPINMIHRMVCGEAETPSASWA